MLIISSSCYCSGQVSVHTEVSVRCVLESSTKYARVSPLPCSSVDVMEEAKKLIGTGNKHLVMGDVVSAVNVFQEACSML